MAELSCDAAGCERRIVKGVNVSRERMRYIQLCDHIESTVAELASGNAFQRVILEQSEWKQYVELLEALATLTIEELCEEMCEGTEEVHVPGVKTVEVSVPVTVKRSLFHDFVEWVRSALGHPTPKPVRIEHRKVAAPELDTTRFEACLERPAPMVEFNRLGKSFFPPGEEVAFQQDFWSLLHRDRFRLRCLEVQPTALAEKRAVFFEAARQAAGAVVELVEVGDET